MPNTLFASNWSFGKKSAIAAHTTWIASDKSHSALMDAAVAGAMVAERDLDVLTVGAGGMPNALGEVELDAAVMDGLHLEAGAVAALRGFATPSAIACDVMRHSPHVFLVGEGAERFALARSHRQENLITSAALAAWEKHRGTPPLMDPSAESNHDTVGVIGWHDGHVVAVCSTSGMSGKLPGRVGDSPIIGAGLYADNEGGAAVATGMGDHILRSGLCLRVVDHMTAGASAQEACDQVLHALIRRRPECASMMIALLAIDRNGTAGTRATTTGYQAHLCSDGEHIALLPPPLYTPT